MAVYVMLTNLTEEGRKTLKQSPDRLKEVNKEVEAMGVKILCQYALLGQYDFINILEAPDNKAIAKVALELGARGTLKTMTMAAMLGKEQKASEERSSTWSFSEQVKPGQLTSSLWVSKYCVSTIFSTRGIGYMLDHI